MPPVPVNRYNNNVPLSPFPAAVNETTSCTDDVKTDESLSKGEFAANLAGVFDFNGVGFAGVFAFGGGLSSFAVSRKADPLVEGRKVNFVFALS